MAGARALLVCCSCWWWLRIAAATELDLLSALSLHNTSRVGVSRISGTQPQRTAYLLQGETRSLQIDGDTFERAAELLRRSTEFAVLATLKQEPANSGTILSFSHGFDRYLEVQSSGRRDEVRLHYVAGGERTPRVESFPLRLADGAWHRLALAVSGAVATLYVDCHPLYRRLIRPPDRNLSRPQLSLWIGQRNGKHSLFKGSLQEVRLSSGPGGARVQCPGLAAECPTCGQFSMLQATVAELTEHLRELTVKVAAAEGRVSHLERCDCSRACLANGTLHPDGASWQRRCDRCSCVHGEITCRPVDCERVECKNPVLHPGECCPTCLRQCLLKGNLYEHGERFAPKECAECVCHDGNMQCARVDPSRACPPLPCDPSYQFTVPGECCKFCPGVDYCSMGHSCDENATCMNLNTKYTCKCNQGFQGDGLTCKDVDECQEEGGVSGHHCHSNTRCVNLPGSYLCRCLPGHTRKDKFSCVEVDECVSEAHECDVNAECRNSPGSYECECRPGFQGDGRLCQPVCEGGCLNGGRCASPGRCLCPVGFEGERCERDRDECSSARTSMASSKVMPSCPSRAICVNTPGSYYCRCRAGFRTSPSDGSCEDVDECSEGSHTCPPHADCVNTQGSFQCRCREESCHLGCVWQGAAVSEGARWNESGGCRACSCVSGVASCRDRSCSCDLHSDTDLDLDADLRLSSSEDDRPVSSDEPEAWATCCSRCEPRFRCRHQELRHVWFRSGERWLYQCQLCECLLGETDCWEPECSTGEGACCASAGVDAVLEPAGLGLDAEGASSEADALALQRAGCSPHCQRCQRETLAGGGGAMVGASQAPRSEALALAAP